ncbi:MAG: hydrogenase 4 subunit B [Pseudorhodoplanes sp.]|jgi:formate hydrogenlyase subunit 3/multisubunit Na+/H+ antiporter MnhD subunit|nr:hydrogenase 4 subunit B [Pseudorhodoplanes sp.]
MPAIIGLLNVAGFLVVAALAVAIGRRPAGTLIVYGASLVIAAVGIVTAFVALVSDGSVATLALPLGLPLLGAHFRVDALAAFFLLVVNLGGAVASLYGLGYGRHERSPLRILPYFPAYLGGMNLVLLADDAFTFLVGWEFMSLASWALVLAHHRESGNARAGFIYIVMASAGTLCLLLTFGLLAGPDGGYAFDTMRSHPPQSAVAISALLLALIGAGSKAGLVPLHVWLPLAHPAAPSHVSALMSGVMTKVAIYGFIRIAFDLIDEPVWWTSLIILAIGATTAVLGVLYALMQQDIKRLLAYSTVENVGIIFIGLGLTIAFRANDMPVPAALAMSAALLHVFNHSLFKSLLFFGAGAVLHATGERDMERLGGLVHRMPRTAFAFLTGCAAISALPPLNGFVSEWLTFQAILVSPQLPQLGLKFMVPTVGALLALAAALAAACFVKAFGVTFLGRARTPAAQNAHETDRFSLAAMFILAAMCLLAGILPGVLIDLLAPVVGGLVGGRMPQQITINWLSIIPIEASRSSYNGIIILVFLISSGMLTAMVIHRFATRATRRSAIWDCGYPDPSLATQYSGSSFSMPIRRVFGTMVFDVRERVDMPRPGAMRAGLFYVKIFDPAWRFAYGPAGRAVLTVSKKLNRLQFLTIRRYLTLVFAALIVLLILVAAWR